LATKYLVDDEILGKIKLQLRWRNLDCYNPERLV